jgi:geranylgeranyl diphosphate synthase, type II
LTYLENRRFISILEKEQTRINRILKKTLQSRNPLNLYLPAYYIIESGGKRLRPLLVLFSTKAAGGKFSDSYYAGSAVELLHNFTLVHDDIMDNADKRRGRLTLHVKFDNSTAILAGDALLAVAYENLLKDCKNNSHNIFVEFTRGLIEVCEGQSLDKEFEVVPMVTLNEYLFMIRKKTAAMLEMCCSIGAQLGNGSEKEIKALADFGRNIGMAFQIQDDLLDVTADETEFGKTVGGDLVEGKKTFLLIKGLEKAKGKNKVKLESLVKLKGIKKHQINEYKKIYEDIGVIDDAKNEINKYTNLALRSLNVLEQTEDREIFKWLAESLIKRNK